MASGHESGFSVPKIGAWSTFLPIASTISGLISFHSGTSESSMSASGIGTMTASSSAVMVTFFQSALLVFFRPVSPSTQ
ncbi:hypothetical protein NLL32_02380 [Corynebacterium propinquum]|nr:hypothetical protein [Corynebacterium propinquum]MDK4312732.1 hypothetical protein [Corynebacterium propinquum]WKS49749.1 hypothetical protein NLL32_02380 [Corynebacterium propinquum]